MDTRDFNRWHLVRTSEVNSKVFVENKIVRPYFADPGKGQQC